LEPELRYSNFFWVLPDKHVYMVTGYNGQMIMVLPDLDVVAVTTARDSHNFSEFAGFVSRSVKSDTTIPADPAAAKLLNDKISDASNEKPTKVGWPRCPLRWALLSSRLQFAAGLHLHRAP
jgi:hypothetical protein